MFKNYCVAVTNKEFPSMEDQNKAQALFSSGKKILYYSKIVFVRSFKALDNKVECTELLNLSDNKEINEFYKDVLVSYGKTEKAQEILTEAEPEANQEVETKEVVNTPTPPAKKVTAKKAKRTKAKTEE